MSSNTFASLSSMLDTAASFFVGLGQRILVHLCSIIAAILVAASIAPSQTSVGVCAYVGLVCLIPRGLDSVSQQIIPSVAGVVLMVLWAACGVPWQYTILWGGIVAWGIRLLLRRGQLGWDGLALPFLLISLYLFFANLASFSPVAPPYWLAVVLLAAGLAAAFGHARLRGSAVRRQMLQRARLKLEQKLGAGGLPEDLRLGAAHLERQGRMLLDCGQTLGPADEPLLQSFTELAGQIARVTAHTPHSSVRGLEARASETNQKLHERLEEIRRTQAPAKERTPLEVRLDGFAASAGDLVRKAGALPGEIRPYVLGISRATGDILECMRTDPQDVAPGDRFLTRYLTAVHTVVDEYRRLAGTSARSENSEALKARSAELLQRLERAFIQEHVSLQRNDAVNLTAELNVLDKLLQMDGK